MVIFLTTFLSTYFSKNMISSERYFNETKKVSKRAAVAKVEYEEKIVRLNKLPYTC